MSNKNPYVEGRYNLPLKVSLTDNPSVYKEVYCKRYNELQIGRAICDLKGIVVYKKGDSIWMSRDGYDTPTSYRNINKVYLYFYEMYTQINKVKIEVLRDVINGRPDHKAAYPNHKEGQERDSFNAWT